MEIRFFRDGEHAGTLLVERVEGVRHEGTWLPGVAWTDVGAAVLDMTRRHDALDGSFLEAAAEIASTGLVARMGADDREDVLLLVRGTDGVVIFDWDHAPALEATRDDGVLLSEAQEDHLLGLLALRVEKDRRDRDGRPRKR